MHPVQWHYKVVRIPIDVTKSCKYTILFTFHWEKCSHNKVHFSISLTVIEKHDGENDVKIIVMAEDGYELIQQSMQTQNLLNVPKQSLFDVNKNDSAIVKSERSKSLDPTYMLKHFEQQQRRGSSISSLGNWTGAVILSTTINSSKKSNGKWYLKTAISWIRFFIRSNSCFLGKKSSIFLI